MQSKVAYTIKESPDVSVTRVVNYDPTKRRHACLYQGRTPDGIPLEYCVFHSVGPSQRGDLFASPAEFAVWKENGECLDTCHLSGEASRRKFSDERKAFLRRVGQEEKRFSDSERSFADLPFYLKKRSSILREIRRIEEILSEARADHFRQERAILVSKKVELELVDSDIRANYLVSYQTTKNNLTSLEKLDLGRVVLFPGNNSASLNLIETIISEYRKKIESLSSFFPPQKEEKKAVFKSLPTLTIAHRGEIRVN